MRSASTIINHIIVNVNLSITKLNYIFLIFNGFKKVVISKKYCINLNLVLY